MDFSILTLVVGGGIGGLIGALVMNGFMFGVSRWFSERVDMTKALGSLLTGNLENARATGTLVHCFSGFVFGVIYLILFDLTQLIEVSNLVLLGAGIGFIHGLVVSYGLMFVVSERHPIEQFRTVTIETGLLHLIGHVLFGLTVGLSCGLAFFWAG
jgi:hypothetical protein